MHTFQSAVQLSQWMWAMFTMLQCCQPLQPTLPCYARPLLNERHKHSRERHTQKNRLTKGSCTAAGVSHTMRHMAGDHGILEQQQTSALAKWRDMCIALRCW
jgi:hypothetical protein